MPQTNDTHPPKASRRFAPHALALLLALSFSLTHTGPFRWLASLQLQHLGFFSFEATALVVYLLGWLLGTGTLALVMPVEPSKNTDIPAPHTSQENNNTKGKWWLGSLGLLCLLVAMIWFVLPPKVHKDAPLLQAASLEAGQRPTHTYVELVGRLERSQTITIRTDKGREQTTDYIPIVSSGWKRGQAIKVYLYKPQKRAIKKQTSFKGRLIYEGLPGIARAVLRQRSRTEPKGYWVLLPPSSTATRHTTSLWLGAIGLLLLAGVRFW